MYPRPYIMTSPASCAAHPVYNAITVSAGFAKPTGNINATAGSFRLTDYDANTNGPQSSQ